MFAWILFGVSVWLNGILWLFIWAAYRNNAHVERERAQYKALAEAAIEELKRMDALVKAKARQPEQPEPSNPLRDVLQKMPANQRVH